MPSLFKICGRINGSDPTAEQNLCLTTGYSLIMKEILCNFPNYTVLLAHKIHKNPEMPPNCTKVSNIWPPDPLPRLYRSLQIGSKNCEPNPPSRLHKNLILHGAHAPGAPHPQQGFMKMISKIHVCMSQSKKPGVSLVISEYALKYSGLDSSISSLKIPKRHIRCHQTVPRFQNFPVEACPRTPPSKASRKLSSRFIFA